MLYHNSLEIPVVYTNHEPPSLVYHPVVLRHTASSVQVYTWQQSNC